MSFSPDMVADGMGGGKALPGKSNGRSYQLDVMKLFFVGSCFFRIQILLSARTQGT